MTEVHVIDLAEHLTSRYPKLYSKMVVTRSETFVYPRKTRALMQANEQKKGYEFKHPQIFMNIVHVIHLEVNLVRFILLI